MRRSLLLVLCRVAAVMLGLLVAQGVARADTPDAIQVLSPGQSQGNIHLHPSATPVTYTFSISNPTNGCTIDDESIRWSFPSTFGVWAPAAPAAGSRSVSWQTVAGMVGNFGVSASGKYASCPGTGAGANEWGVNWSGAIVCDVQTTIKLWNAAPSPTPSPLVITATGPQKNGVVYGYKGATIPFSSPTVTDTDQYQNQAWCCSADMALGDPTPGGSEADTVGYFWSLSGEYKGSGQSYAGSFADVGVYGVSVSAGDTRPAEADPCPDPVTGAQSHYMGTNIQYELDGECHHVDDYDCPPPPPEPAPPKPQVVSSGQDGDISGSMSAYIVELVGINVSRAYKVPNTSNPEVWAAKLASLTDSDTTDDYVVLTVNTNPGLPADLPDGVISWSGGEAVPIEGTNPVEYDPLQRRVSRATVAATNVTVTVLGHSATVKVVVCAVSSLTSDANNITGGEHATTTVEASGNSFVTVTANMNTAGVDVSAVYDKLITWTGGQPVESHPDQRKVSRKYPSKNPLKAECGVSKDDLTVWVVRINLDIAGVLDSEEDTKAATVYINTDDDNNSATVDPPFNGSDLNESPVQGEKDLISLAVTVEPEGVGGTLTLDKSGAAKVGIWKNADKSGTLPQDLTWDLSTRLNSNPNDDQNHPRIAWVEGRSVSDNTGDQALKLTYDWGIHLEDTVKATVEARPGSSEACLRLCKVGANETVGDEVYDPVGGRMFVVLEIRIGPGERMDPSMNNVTVRVKEDSDLHTAPSNRKDWAAIDLTTASGWEKKASPTAQWTSADTSPKQDNKEGGTSVYYRTKVTWQTTTEPLGHNGHHTLSLAAVNGDTNITNISFQHFEVPDWQTAYACGPIPKTAYVKNLVIKDVKTNVNEDYFIFDPDSTDAEREQPRFQFTIEDAGDPHQYKWVIYIQPTSTEPDPAAPQHLAYLTGSATTPGQVTATWNGQQNNNTGPLMDRGTYTFDIYVDEVEDATAQNPDILDQVEFKTPYSLTIPETYQTANGETKSGHTFGFVADAEQGLVPKATYYLDDSWNSDAGTVTLWFLDPDFTVHQSAGGGTTNHTPYEITLSVDLTISPSLEHSSEPWRAIFTAIDRHEDKTRDHQPRHMIAVNDTDCATCTRYISGDYAGAHWEGVWHIGGLCGNWHYKTNYLDPIQSIVNYVDTNLPQTAAYPPPALRYALNGTFFNHGEAPYRLIGHVGTDSGWVGYDVRYCRWAFGINPSGPSFAKARMVNSAPGMFTTPSSIRGLRYGLGGIGCLIDNGTPVNDKNLALEGFTEMDNKQARSCFAYNSNGRHSFMIMAVQPYLWGGGGWTWTEARDFFTTGLPTYLYQNYKLSLTLCNALLLDGGSHSTLAQGLLFGNQPNNRVIDYIGFTRDNRSLIQLYFP